MTELLLHAPGALADIVLRQGAQISGTVWDGQGNPMTEARIGFAIGASRTNEAHGLISKLRSLWPRAKVNELGRPLSYDPNGPSHELSKRLKIQQDRTIVVDYETRTIN
ncbi:MAG: hypothetical protein GY809_19940 [Planctomycetes bacterium]|nr:hypothetical protein [Planctomycetota bacterium]